MKRLAGAVLSWLALALAATAGAAAEPFADATAASGLDFVHFNGMSGELFFPEMTGGGAALFDYDGDGDVDLFLTQGHMLGEGKAPAEAVFPPRHPEPFLDRLYRNDLEVGPDGAGRPRWVDVTAASGLAETGYGMGVATGDYDGDGLIDLYVTNFGPNTLWRNQGDGTFRDVTAESGAGDTRWSVAATFFDYDGDGRLDLFVGNYVDFSFAVHRVCGRETGERDYCGPLAYEAQPDRLLRNRGDGTFEDVSAASGIARQAGGALGAVAADFNGDGKQDLYVANDGSPNFLWLNRGDGTFEDEALLAGCALSAGGQPEASMGVVASDFDDDGDEDLLLTHLTGETNTFYRNDGRGLFRDETVATGLGAPSWSATGFGAAALDYDLDGRLDVVVVNGAVKTIEALARKRDPYPLHQPNQLYRNLGDGGFADVSAGSGAPFAQSEVSRGLAVGDVDRDGDPDLVVVNNAGPARLLLNRVRGRPWIGATLVAAGAPALQARAALRISGGVTMRRRVHVDGSFASAHDPALLFAWGAAGEAEALEISWPDGARMVWRKPAARRHLEFRR